MSRRRENAYTLMQRLKATPVGLLPPIVHNATDGGLRQGEVLLVGGVPGTGKKTWVYRVAAQHLSNGGAVTFVFFPGSGNFMMRRFMEHLEAFTQYAAPLPLETVAHASLIEKRRESLLCALDRLEVVHCVDITDFAVFCMHKDAKATTTAAAATTATASVASSEAVPLVVAMGCGGRGSHLHHMERAMGHEVPLCRWLFGFLQRRRRCALILVEEWGSEKLEGHLSHDGVHHQQSCFTRSAHSFAATVEAESEILRRVQSETSKAAENTAQLPVKRRRACPVSSSFTATAASLEAVTDAFPFLMGNLRLFFLYMQAVPTAAHQTVSVAHLLQWHSTESRTEDEDATGMKTSTEAPRQQRWRHAKKNTLHLRGEVLCAAQL